MPTPESNIAGRLEQVAILFAKHGVEYIVIGGMAFLQISPVAHGDPHFQVVGTLLSKLVASVGVAENTHRGVVGEDALKAA